MPQGASLPARIAEWAGTGTTYYVDQSIGSDSNTEGQAQSESTPWLTIQKAVDSYVLPGSGHVRVLVKNGNYRNTSGSGSTAATVNMPTFGARQPTSSKVLHIMNYPGHSPVVQIPSWGTNDRYCFLFGNSDSTYIRIRGFTLEQPASSAVEVNMGVAYTGGSGTPGFCEVDQCVISGIQSSGGGNPRSQAVYITGPGDGGTYNNIQVWNTLIHDIGNHATETDQLSHGFYIGGDNHVIGNVIVRDCRNGYGIQLYDGMSASVSDGIIITHCTLTGLYKSGMICFGSGFTNVVLRNSIMYDNDAKATSVNSSDGTGRYCLSNLNDLGDFEAGGTWSYSNNITGSSPSFTNYAARDLTLQTGSPCRNGGDINYTPAVDIAGNARTEATLGAYRAAEESGTLYPKAGVSIS